MLIYIQMGPQKCEEVFLFRREAPFLIEVFHLLKKVPNWPFDLDDNCGRQNFWESTSAPCLGKSWKEWGWCTFHSDSKNAHIHPSTFPQHVPYWGSGGANFCNPPTPHTCPIHSVLSVIIQPRHNALATIAIHQAQWWWPPPLPPPRPPNAQQNGSPPSQNPSTAPRLMSAIWSHGLWSGSHAAVDATISHYLRLFLKFTPKKYICTSRCVLCIWSQKSLHVTPICCTSSRKCVRNMPKVFHPFWRFCIWMGCFAQLPVFFFNSITPQHPEIRGGQHPPSKWPPCE